MSRHPFVQQIIQAVKLGRPKPIWYETVTEHFPPLNYERKQKTGKLYSWNPYPTFKKENFSSPTTTFNGDDHDHHSSSQYSSSSKQQTETASLLSTSKITNFENHMSSVTEKIQNKNHAIRGRSLKAKKTCDNNNKNNFSNELFKENSSTSHIRDIPEIRYPEDKIREKLEMEYPLERYITRTFVETSHSPLKLSTEKILHEKIIKEMKDDSDSDSIFLLNKKMVKPRSPEVTETNVDTSLEAVSTLIEEEYCQRQKYREIEDQLARQQSLYFGHVSPNSLIDSNTLLEYTNREEQILEKISELKEKGRMEREKIQNTLSQSANA